jgi:hypothetical protein
VVAFALDSRYFKLRLENLSSPNERLSISISCGRSFWDASRIIFFFMGIFFSETMANVHNFVLL